MRSPLSNLLSKSQCKLQRPSTSSGKVVDKLKRDFQYVLPLGNNTASKRISKEVRQLKWGAVVQCPYALSSWGEASKIFPLLKGLCLAMVSFHTWAGVAQQSPDWNDGRHLNSDNRAQHLSSSLPTFPISLGATGNFALGERYTHYQFANERVLFKANAGWGYAARGTGIIGVEAAALVGESASLGLNLNYQQDKLEAILHHMQYWMPGGWRWKGAFSYMHGRQSFNFLQTQEKAKLSQLAYYGAIDWLDVHQIGFGLQSIGLAVWGGRSKNHSQFDEQEYASDTPDYFLLTRDHRWLSEGRLGGAALSFQYSPGTDFRWVFKGSAGQEWLKYPYMNGSADSYRKLYLDARADYQLSHLSGINLGYKYGAVESRVELGWRHSYLGLSGFYSQGKHGLDDQYGIVVSVDLLAAFNKTKQPAPHGINRIDRLNYAVRDGEIRPLALLQETILRPLPLPTHFMVKVDPTGVKHLRLEKASLPSGSIVTSQGNVYIPVTQGPSVISVAEVNGQPVSGLEMKFNTQDNQLVVMTRNLPDPVDIDTYVVDVEDGLTGDVYRVSFELVVS